MNAQDYLKAAATLVFEDDPYCAELPTNDSLVDCCAVAAYQGMACCAGHWLAHAYKSENRAELFTAAFEACAPAPEAVFHFVKYARQAGQSIDGTARGLIGEWAEVNPDMAMYGAVDGMTAPELAK